MLIRVFSYMKPYRKYAFLAGLCVAVECMFELIIPVLMANIVDVGVKNGDTGYIFTQGALMCLCAVIALFLGSVKIDNQRTLRRRITVFININQLLEWT